MMNFVPGRASTLQDVARWAEKTRGVDDRRALARVEALWENVPLSARRLDLPAFEAQFPLHGFDPARHKSEPAYRAWRRKVIAVLKAFLAQTIPQPVVPTIAPQAEAAPAWQLLLTAVRRVAHDGDGALFVAQRVIPIENLARQARLLGLTPRDLSPKRLAELGAPLTGNERSIIIRALRNLNMMRDVPEIAAHLPQDPYDLKPWPRKRRIAELPEGIQREIAGWLEVSCGGKWDPVAQVMIDQTSADDRSRKDVALRRYCAAAFAACPDLSREIPLADLITEDIATHVLRLWLGEGGKLKDRSIAGYVSSIKAVAAHNDVDVAPLAALERTAQVLRRGKLADQVMSPRVRKFCEGLLDSKAQQVKLMTLHVRARRLAQSILDQAAADNRDLSSAEATRVRQLGSFAAFCAIETCAAPLRIERAMNLRHRGPKADLLLPTPSLPHARILLPAKQSKLKRSVEAVLKQDSRNGLDTLLWYLAQIRPLFAFADESEFLFLAVTSANQLCKKTFRSWFVEISRKLGLPMVPHNFRHALASMLIKAHPGQYESVAVLLGDTEGTVRTYYAWVNKRMQVEAAQALVLELANAA